MNGLDLKSVFRQRECGFNSRPGHQNIEFSVSNLKDRTDKDGWNMNVSLSWSEIRRKCMQFKSFSTCSFWISSRRSWGFQLGAAEASPFVAKLVRISSPFVGVAASKLFALFIGGLVHPSLAHCELD
jgi:hypothetical protein